ncbi:uncharacterized protein T551_01948 [Pneumocystis jirovecii RU7]|uniref:Histone deacetylase complex subunit SAP30 Sin3 binding domain-containing protein n=1 Tax=Pneumocystis jirovecii (strain RU7) TaxID=1408657 RepID=A0A0W4ZNQ5_PNEJ7|nr:uncharacterized protein T551_01948 [Pneumocystis jirovecii RU7]KTW30004.1 hypothetical protein T551_01948 [Pneumocystis jirovecii RU7]
MPPRTKHTEPEQRLEVQDRSSSRQKRLPGDRLEGYTVRETTPASTCFMFDVSTLPIVALRRYRNVYKLQASGGDRPGDIALLSGGDALKNAVRKHFNALPVKEYDMIVQFLYTVKNKDKVFRRYFHDEVI